RARRLHEELDRDRIVLVAGFQGVSTDYEVTTLGRGGSDATAVALAAALGGACEIYTDVEGVFTADPRIVADALKLPTISYEEMLEMAATGARVMMARSIEIARSYGVPLHVRAAHGDTQGTWIREEENLVLEKAIISGVYSADPRIVPGAHKLDRVSFEEMLEMSASGAGVLQLRSVEYARNHGVRIHCRSSFEDGPGTLVVAEEETMENPFVTAVTHSNSEARVTLNGLRDEPGVAGRVFGALADANVNVDVIIQNEPVGDDQLADLSFTVDRSDLPVAKDTIAALGDVSLKVLTDEQIGKVSIVGAGMRSHPGVAAKVFRVLGEEGINIEMISTSPIKISCVIAADRVKDAVNVLHKAFELGEDAIQPEDPTGPDHRPTVAG
ncbi:MAG TPA: aspartate kinase, partial [Solirubrobacterales bacterium]|nr:aspartate kinase [Solirubrobacterales bacterium]